MLGYVFWHRPRADVEPARYEEAHAAFHAALADEAVEGFHGSSSYAVPGLPWLDGDGYEDWYLLEGFFALDPLNRAAVSGPMEEPHRAVASLTGSMAAGLVALVQGVPEHEALATWFRKPEGESYEELYERLGGAGGSLWRRQMVLGPTPEFCLLGPSELEGVRLDRRRIV